MRKNILIISHSDSMQFLESCNQYTQMFDPTQYEVTVAYLTGKPDERHARTLAEQVIYFDFSKAQIRGLKLVAIRKLLHLCREKKFEIVICHRYKPIYIMLWVAKFYHIPKLIFVMHAMNTMHAIFRKLIVASLVQKNMFFVGVSAATRDDLRKSLWGVAPERVIALYNVLDYELYEPKLLSSKEARKELSIPETTFVFGHVARFVKEKDQSTLLKAYATFRQQHTNTLLVMIGYGKLESQLKAEAAQLGLDKDVIFTGSIPDSYRLMKAFDVFVLPSVEEAFGRVLLEAMMASTPIIAARADGIPEVMGDTGFLVEPSQPLKLAETMAMTYRLPKAELVNQGAKGYQRMIDHFSMDATKKTFWQLIET